MKKTEGCKILLLFHNLNREGAPIALLNVGRLLVKNGYEVAAFSPCTGVLAEKLEALSIELICTPFDFDEYPDEYDGYLKRFDLVIANTIMMYRIVENLEGEVSLIWYLHEGKLIRDYFMKIIPDLKAILKRTENILVVSEYVRDFLIEEKLVEQCDVIENFVEDDKEKAQREKNLKAKAVRNVTVIGTVNYNKGFDLVIQAYHRLEASVRKKLHISFVGKIVDESYYEDCLEVLEAEDSIEWIEFVQGQRKWDLFRDTDVIIVPSRDESSSLVALEACMCQKPLVVSENVGAKYMVSDENGWIFANEDVEALTNILREIISSNDLEEMGKKSRENYEKFASETLFEKKLLEKIEKTISSPGKKEKGERREEEAAKKILLVNMWYQKEYANCLEAYAMERILKDNGFLVDTVGFIPPHYREECRTSFSLGFAQRNLSLAQNSGNRKALSMLAENYDVLITGPGKVWGKEDDFQVGGFVNWLDFAAQKNILIACHVSIDTSVLTFFEKNPKISRYLIERFDAIRVVDEQSQRNYHLLTGKQAEDDMSPVFYLPKEAWHEIIGRRRIFCEYVIADFAYFKQFSGMDRVCRQNIVSENQKLKVVYHNQEKMEVEEWLSSIYYAASVITDSYVTASLALVFGKRVHYLENRREDTDKIYSLLGKIDGLEGFRENSSIEKNNYYTIESMDISKKVKQQKQAFITWLIGEMDTGRAKKTNNLAEEFIGKLMELEHVVEEKQKQIEDIIEKREIAFVERDKREQFLIEENQKLGEELVDMCENHHKELEIVRNSTIWKVGAFVTWIPRQIKDTIRGRKKLNITSKIRTMGMFRQQYGKRGLLRAIFNKLTGRPLDYKLAVPSNPMSRDEIGRTLFATQQRELSFHDMKKRMEAFQVTPKLSILMPVYNAPVKWLEVAVKSLQNQIYETWELCVVNDGSSERAGFEMLLEMAKRDSRIKCLDNQENQGISGASNDALNIATGEYVLLLDQDDEITADALFWFVNELNIHPEAEFVYSDECKVDGEEGTELSYFICKPDWSPEMMLNQMYTGHLSMYKTELVRQVGGFRSAFDFSQDYDLALRISEMTDKIYHIERILYFWRSIPTSSAAGGKDYARESNINALKDYLINKGIQPVMQKNPYANYAYMVMENEPKVSIIVPSDSCDNMKRTVEGILDCTEYDNYEIILVTNSNAIKEMKTLCHTAKVNYCAYDLPYNFSAKCNAGAGVAKGEFVVFYNDDVIPRKADWLIRMLELFQLEGVEGVSPMLVYEDNTIQYAGMISGVRGQVGTSFHMRHFENIDYWFHQYLVRDVSILSGACVAMRTDIFREIGGFDAEHTPSAHSDIDLSYKLLEKGYRCVYTPYSLMTHIGNHSWEVKGVKEKAPIYCLKRWGKYISRDSYFTESMKNLFYYTDRNYYQIYSPEKELFRKHEGKDILFLTHELTRTGAPVQLFNMIKATMWEMNYFPVVAAPEDGPMKQDFLDMGVTVLVDMELPISATNLDRYARDYDLIVINTMSPICIDAINELKDTLPPILWWIHEGEYAFELFQSGLKKQLNDNVHLFCASEYSQRILLEYSKDYKSEIIRCGVEDFALENSPGCPATDKLIFLVIGTIEWRKGQDILLDAIALLPDYIRERAEFYFIGKKSDENIYQRLLQGQKLYDCVRYLEVIPQKELMEYYKKAACVVVSSRDEPTSLTAIEGMTLSKPCIVSDKTGISEVLEDGKSAYIFRNGDVTELSRKIECVISHRERAEEIGREGRRVYEDLYTMEKFSKRCIQVLETVMGEGKEKEDD